MVVYSSLKVKYEIQIPYMTKDCKTIVLIPCAFSVGKWGICVTMATEGNTLNFYVGYLFQDYQTPFQEFKVTVSRRL